MGVQNLRHTLRFNQVICLILSFSVLAVCLMAVHPTLHSVVHSSCISDDDCAVELFLAGGTATPPPALHAPTAPATGEEQSFPIPAARRVSAGFTNGHSARGPPDDPGRRQFPSHLLSLS